VACVYLFHVSAIGLSCGHIGRISKMNRWIHFSEMLTLIGICFDVLCSLTWDYEMIQMSSEVAGSPIMSHEWRV
jgi:hypothetical protein